MTTCQIADINSTFSPYIYRLSGANVIYVIRIIERFVPQRGTNVNKPIKTPCHHIQHIAAVTSHWTLFSQEGTGLFWICAIKLRRSFSIKSAPFEQEYLLFLLKKVLSWEIVFKPTLTKRQVRTIKHKPNNMSDWILNKRKIRAFVLEVFMLWESFHWKPSKILITLHCTL